MIKLKQRSYQRELLDADNIPFADIQQNMKELNAVNTLLGGHAITIAGVKAFLQKNIDVKNITVCEIGCGGGDNLHAIALWCKKNNINASFTGIDIKKECIDFAKQQYPFLNACWITSDYALVDLDAHKPMIIFSSLFCHHFTEPELVKMIGWMNRNSYKGFFINDLHRHPLAYYSIKLLTSIFSKSYLVKNDAPLSVARGLKQNEWKAIFDNAGISNYSVKWKWAFRHLIVCKHGG
ncbi:class I SAM-dependent methyltransferase [soil metagenome]